MKETFLRKRLNTILYQKETIDEVVLFVENTVKLLNINDACIVSVEDREYRAHVNINVEVVGYDKGDNSVHKEIIFDVWFEDDERDEVEELDESSLEIRTF